MSRVVELYKNIWYINDMKSLEKEEEKEKRKDVMTNPHKYSETEILKYLA